MLITVNLQEKQLLDQLPVYNMPQRILGNIYISSIEPINLRVDLKSDFNISSIVSVVNGPLPTHVLQEYSHLHIDISDEPTSDLLEHLESAMIFMEGALCLPETNDGTIPNQTNGKHKGGVLVHCAQGKSRSVAVTIAFLMYKYNLSYRQALHAVKRKVPDAEPNSGFVEQLQLFSQMHFKVDKSNSAYREYFIKRSLELDPSGGLLHQSGLWQKKKSENNEDTPNIESADSQEHNKETTEDAGKEFNLRCKRCRTVLAQNSDIETHEMPEADSRQAHFVRTVPNSRRIISSVDASKSCSHYFVAEPMDWMNDELSRQELEGKFACPKCDAKVGGYSWKGSRCSCGKWMIPALHLQNAKVDLMKR